MPPVRRNQFEIRRSRTIATRSDHAANLLLDPSTWPSWQPEIIAARGPSPMKRGDTASGRARMLGFEVDGHTTALSTSAGEFEEDVIVGVRMRIRYEISPTPEGIRLTHELTSELPSGPSGWVLSLFLRRRLRHMQATVLANLADQLEAAPSD